MNGSEALKTSRRDRIKIVLIVVKYHPDLPNISKILCNPLPTLCISEMRQTVVMTLDCQKIFVEGNDEAIAANL